MIKKEESNLKNFYNIMIKLPVFGVFSMVAFYNLILVYLLIYAAYRKIKQLWIISLPLIISDLVIIAGPLVHPRYAFPIVYSMPIVIAFSLFIIRKMCLTYTSNDK